MTNPLEDKAKLLDLNAPSISIAGTHEERTTELMLMFDEAELRIEEERKTWEETLLYLEKILEEELEKGEFVPVPNHLTFEEFDEWLKGVNSE